MIILFGGYSCTLRVRDVGYVLAPILIQTLIIGANRIVIVFVNFANIWDTAAISSRKNVGVIFVRSKIRILGHY